MTGGTAGGTGGADGPSPRPRAGVGARIRDLAMGARFAVAGGRQGWARTLLTAVGVGLGVAMLLLASAVPTMQDAQYGRENARSGAEQSGSGPKRPGDDTILSSKVDTEYHRTEMYGRLLRPEGDHPPKPPGVHAIPRDGEMVVSPELAKLLHSPQGRELADRLDAEVVGTIGRAGLMSPGEYAFYKGDAHLAKKESVRFDHFSDPIHRDQLPPQLLLLLVVACAVLVFPVAVLIGTAVRFGGERRDARLAALRLVGADSRAVRRVAAGEALVGALLGLAVGGGLFMAARQLIGSVRVFGMSFFSSDVTPVPWLAALVAVAVPVVSLLVTLFALRGVSVEPLGVVRSSEQRRRRLWWRLIPPLAGLAMLSPMLGSIDALSNVTGQVLVIGGVTLLLGGVVVLLPWLVERFVRRLRGGPPSWQLAVRRLQLNGGHASRAVSGITVAVAGAIALQMLFTGLQQDLQDAGPATADHKNGLTVNGSSMTSSDSATKLTERLRQTEGVRQAQGYVDSPVAGSSGVQSSIGVADCSTVRALARTTSCHDGQVFLADRPQSGGETVEPGATVDLGTGGRGGKWRVPDSARRTKMRRPPADVFSAPEVLATPGALAVKRLEVPTYRGWAVTDPKVPHAIDHVRTTLFRVNPHISTENTEPSSSEQQQLAGIQQGIEVAASGLLVLIGLSLVVSTVEQLRERRRQLAVLVAFGTRRGTLAASVLWQTAVPVLLGTVVAVGFGLGLGSVLLQVLTAPGPDWLVWLPAAGAGLALIGLVTLASLPFLWRLMRPDGLRTE